MRKVLAFLAVAFPAVVIAQTPQLRSGATIYIVPGNGFETYLAAALVQKHVPLVIVADKDKADFIIQSSLNHVQPTGPATVVNQTTNVGNGGGNDAFERGMDHAQQRAAERAALGSSSTSIAVIDPKSSQIVFAVAASETGSDQLQKAAEDCAKHLKKFIEKPKK